MLWVKMTSTLRLEDLRHHGNNNKYVVKVMEELRSSLKKMIVSVGWKEEMNSGHCVTSRTRLPTRHRGMFCSEVAGQ